MFFSTIAIASVAALAVASPVKRGFGGRATFYATGLGACGEYNNDSDYIVALNSAQYGGGYPGPECFKQIQISANGKTATATIMDECPTCNYGDLDMSPSLFNHFANPDDGIFQMTWDYVNSAQARAVDAEEVAVESTSASEQPTASSTSEWSASSSASASVSASSTYAPAAAPTVTAILNGTFAALAEAVAEAGSVVIVGASNGTETNGTTVANATVVFQ
jgi:hypothetical protein